MDRPNHGFITDVIAGSISSSVAKTVVAPMERVKILLQTLPKPQDKPDLKNGNLRSIFSIIHQQGFLSLWRGNVANVLRYFPNQALSLAVKDVLRDSFLGKKQLSVNTEVYRIFLANLAAGGLAGGICLAGTYPLDLIRTRMAGDASVGSSSMRYKTILGTFQTVYSSGASSSTIQDPKYFPRQYISQSSVNTLRGVAALFRGFNISLIGVVVYKAIHLGGYDTAKDMWERYHGSVSSGPRNPSVQMTFGFAWVWSLIAGSICYPLDTIRRRMMMQDGSGLGGYQLGSYECFKSIVKNEGISALYRGVGINALRSIGGAITLVSYDKIKVVLNRNM